MVSVCMIIYNGEKYIKEQLQSILQQLSPDDEVIISDDGSTDKTIETIHNLNDDRIRVLRHSAPTTNFSGTMGVCYKVGRNAENALKEARGEYIFLADQDDVWMSGKVEACLDSLKHNDLVITNHIPVDSKLSYLVEEDKITPIEKPTFINTLLHTQFLGCCMAFRKSLLYHILPFPSQPLMHDIWIGLMALKFGKIGLIQKPYLLYRRHGSNVSANIDKKSDNPLKFKLLYRIYLLLAYYGRK